MTSQHKDFREDLSPMQEARNAPWKLRNEIRRWLAIPFVRLQFALAGVHYGHGWTLYGSPILQRYRGSVIKIGDHLSLRSHYRSNPMVPNHPVMISTRSKEAMIEIGEHFGMTGGAIVAQTSVRIGDRVMIGANTIITDTDFHPIDPDRRSRFPSDGASKPIVIEADVFIGMSVIILKGVTVGAGAVIGAGSVVTQDVPPRTIVAGNPIRYIGDVARNHDTEK